MYHGTIPESTRFLSPERSVPIPCRRDRQHRTQETPVVKFALFYEIPVARPWDKQSEWRAYKNTLEQVIRGDEAGFHSVWTVEHHFLEEFSHCSNPEVLYGAIAARTEKIRIGYGVRLGPKPYNHPVRSAESAAVLDLLSDGRVELGTGRSSTKLELEGFGIHPNDTREMWHEAVEHIVDCWTSEYTEFEGNHWSLPRRRVIPKPMQDPHPPVWGATGSPDGHRMMGELGLGLLSFSVGTPPEELKERIDIYRSGIAACEQPLGKFINDQAACFTLVNCAETRQASYDRSRRALQGLRGHRLRSAALSRESVQHLSRARDGDDRADGSLRDSGVRVETRRARSRSREVPSQRSTCELPNTLLEPTSSSGAAVGDVG
jgi:alkanesulfonate monooxygenase SsuD/methylene tetrahydromethanopterin reductase-like flavin-dependent oxidoreductase (luciferase family)